MKWIYTGVIRPKLTYACLIWGNKINTKIINKKLNSLNRLACLLTTNLTRTIPQMSLEIILNIEPLDIHIKKLGLITYKRLENKLDKVTWCTDPIKSRIQYWAQDIHSVIKKTEDDRCDTTISDRFTIINTDSFDGKPTYKKLKQQYTQTAAKLITEMVLDLLSTTKTKGYMQNQYICQTHQQYSKWKLKP